MCINKSNGPLNAKPDLAYWRCKCMEAGLNDPVVRWAFENAGNVFLGAKSGELLTLDTEDIGVSPDDAVASIQRLTTCWGIDFTVIGRVAPRLRLVIFDASRVDADLKHVPQWALKRLGYATKLSAHRFFTEVAQRWETAGAIPHEIAFGLGYPAKDVLGFMGLEDLAHTGECGWRVYGDPAESYERGRSFAQARALALACVAA